MPTTVSVGTDIEILLSMMSKLGFSILMTRDLVIIMRI
jgi:hypothetical protein